MAFECGAYGVEMGLCRVDRLAELVLTVDEGTLFAALRA